MEQLLTIWPLVVVSALVPIVVHLLSKKIKTVQLIGSTKGLEDSKTQKSKSIQLNEKWLLVSRLVLLAMFLLATLDWVMPVNKERTSYFIASEYLRHDKVKILLDTIDPEQVQQFSSGFSKNLNSVKHGTYQEDYSRLYAHLQEVPGQKVIIAPKRMSKFQSGIPNRSDQIRWLNLDEDTSFYIGSIFHSDTLQLIRCVGSLDHQILEYKPVQADSYQQENDTILWRGLKLPLLTKNYNVFVDSNLEDSIQVKIEALLLATEMVYGVHFQKSSQGAAALVFSSESSNVTNYATNVLITRSMLGGLHPIKEGFIVAESDLNTLSPYLIQNLFEQNLGVHNRWEGDRSEITLGPVLKKTEQPTKKGGLLVEVIEFWYLLLFVLLLERYLSYRKSL